MLTDGEKRAIKCSEDFDKMTGESAKRFREFHEWYDKLSDKEKEEYCQNLYNELAESLNPIFEPFRKAGMKIPELVTTKRCPACKTTKTKASFQKDRTKKDGYHALCKACVKAYQCSEEGKKSQKRRCEKKRLKFPKRIKARQMLNYAVESGKLPRPDSLICTCGQTAREYHHLKGYEPKHWLDVIETCVSCHRKLHT